MRLLFMMVFISSISYAGDYSRSLINGRNAERGEYPEVVNIRTGNSLCTATVIGSRVIITAAHCAETGATSRFNYKGITYSAQMTRSSLYPNQDHDIALGVLDKSIDVKFATVGGIPKLRDKVTLSGYGCTQEGGTGGNDGVLRVGDSVIVGFDKFDFITKGGASASALCFGDSGGPVFRFMNDAFTDVHIITAVNSKGNIRDTSLLARLDLKASKDFLNNFARVHSVQICGVNRDCLQKEEPQPDPKPDPRPSPDVRKGCWVKFKKKMRVLFSELSTCTRDKQTGEDILPY